MPDGLHRNLDLADGSRVIQKYTGPSKTFTEPGWDAAHNWEDVLTLQPGAVALDFVQPHHDLKVSALPDGSGVLHEIGGMRAVSPVYITEEYALALLAECDRARTLAQQAADTPAED